MARLAGALRPREAAKNAPHVMRGKIGQAEIPMKPDHRLRDNLLVEAERSEPLSRIFRQRPRPRDPCWIGRTPAVVSRILGSSDPTGTWDALLPTGRPPSRRASNPLSDFCLLSRLVCRDARVTELGVWPLGNRWTHHTPSWLRREPAHPQKMEEAFGWMKTIGARFVAVRDGDTRSRGDCTQF